MHEHGAVVLDDVSQETSQVLASIRLRMLLAQGSNCIAVEDAAREGGDGLSPREAEDIEHVLLADGLAAEGDELVEHGLRIAHASIGALRNGIGGLLIELHLLESRDVKQVL